MTVAILRKHNRFITVGTGRETLQRGELLHFRPSWLNRDEKTIEVPLHQDCDCQYFRGRAKQYADSHDDVSFEEALDDMWSPKTDASARRIPYGWSPRVIATVEDFAEEVGSLDMHVTTINRRVDELAERADIDDFYLNALRATAATFWIRRGLELHHLRELMGWASIDVGLAYIRGMETQLGLRTGELSAAMPTS